LYDLGADSLTLLELIDRIREVSGVGLELSELSHEVSLAEILSRIAAAADRSDEVTVEVWQEGAGRDVLCLIHPVGGDLQSYRALVTALPSELTVCLIADPGLRLPSPLRWTLDERARAYRAALESRFPSERWRIRLAGWSFGAWVAMGMAHHAESAGEHVDALYLLDPPASDAGVEITKFGPEELARVFQHELGQAGENQSGSSGYEYARRLAACCEANVHSMIGYRPPRLRATPSWVWLASRAVTDLPYFRPGPDSVATWQRLLPQLEELRTIDATHYEVVRPPHIEQIAGTIAETIGELV
jgi:thioesterase domain-containing protein